MKTPEQIRAMRYARWDETSRVVRLGRATHKIHPGRRWRWQVTFYRTNGMRHMRAEMGYTYTWLGALVALGRHVTRPSLDDRVSTGNPNA